MRKPLLWLVTTVLAISILIGYYEALRGAPRSEDEGARLADAEKDKKASCGTASFYEVDTNGTRTSSGVPLNDSVSTAAHRTLPFGTLVRVTNLSNGSCETVKITDRGPYCKGRLIDLSLHAAKKLDMIEAGIIPVEIEVLHDGPESP